MAVTGQLNNRWYLYPQQTKKKNELAWGLNIPGPVAQVLINRGINTVEEGVRFLNPSLSRLHSPFSIKDMDRAVSLVQKALNRDEKIAIYGDYDVDGVTATALLHAFLNRIGGNTIYYIPNRLAEGYGLNMAALDRLKSQGVSLIITVDCGVSSFKEIAYARDIGMEVVVTDHHHPPEHLPEAGAVINPLRPDCPYPFKQLSGAGVAFKLAQALEEQAGKAVKVWDYLDLVALGTIADVCPLVGENRPLVAFGLALAENKLRPGLEALCSAAGLKRPALTTEDVAFVISPRLNAAGRLGDAGIALELLLAASLEQAAPMAQHLHEENTRRQKLETKIFTEATTLVENMLAEKPELKFILLFREGWHQGVLGIVANKIAEKYRLPAVLLGLENGVGRGSGRSSGGFSLIEALEKCRTLLAGYGGHASAAGLTVEEALIPDLTTCLEGQARHFFETQEPEPELFIDAFVEPSEICPELVRALDKLEPYGYGNPRPYFLGSDWSLEHKREVGKGKNHLQLKIMKNGMPFRGISFNGTAKLQQSDLYRGIDIVFSVAFDRWRGNDALQLEIHQSAYCDDFSGDRLSLVDRRGISEKKRYLESLLKKKETVLVVVNTQQKLKRLQSQLSGWAGIVFSHQGDVPRLMADNPPIHLVLYDLPMREEKLRHLLGNLHRTSPGDHVLNVHLLYDEADFQENLKLFAATIPSLGSIEQVFHLLQETAAGQSMEWQILKNRLKRGLSFASTSHLLESCLSILKQTAYIKPEGKNKLSVHAVEAADYCQLLKDVAKTEGYIHEKNRWEQSILWQRYLLDAPADQIIKGLDV